MNSDKIYSLMRKIDEMVNHNAENPYSFLRHSMQLRVIPTVPCRTKSDAWIKSFNKIL